MPATTSAVGVMPATASVVVVAGLHKFDAVAEDFVHQAVGLIDPPRPNVATEVLQVFRFADAGEWIAEGGLHQVEHPERGLSVRVDSISEILQALVLERCAPSGSRARSQGVTPNSRRNAARSVVLVRPRRPRVM